MEKHAQYLYVKLLFSVVLFLFGFRLASTVLSRPDSETSLVIVMLAISFVFSFIGLVILTKLIRRMNREAEVNKAKVKWRWIFILPLLNIALVLAPSIFGLYGEAMKINIVGGIEYFTLSILVGWFSDSYFLPLHRK